LSSIKCQSEPIAPLKDAMKWKFNQLFTNCQIDFCQVLNSFQNYLYLIKELTLIQCYCNDQVVLFDESLTTHTNYSFLEGLSLEKRASFFPSGLIHLSGNSEIIKQRLLQKIKRDKNEAYYLDLNLSSIEKSMNNSTKKKDLIKKNGIPVITLDATQDIGLLCSQVNYWIINHFC
jgi:hypothetical protein